MHWFCGTMAHSPIFWLTGEPARERSTLMRYLSSSSDFRSRLEEGSTTRCYILYHCFRLNDHLGFRNTLKGFLLSLYQQIDQWTLGSSDSVDDKSLEDEAISIDFWRYELKSRFENLASPVYILLDGLDEYEDERATLLLNMVEGLTCKNVKFCLVSRYEPALALRLEGVPSMDMQAFMGPSGSAAGASVVGHQCKGLNSASAVHARGKRAANISHERWPKRFVPLDVPPSSKQGRDWVVSAVDDEGKELRRLHWNIEGLFYCLVSFKIKWELHKCLRIEFSDATADDILQVLTLSGQPNRSVTLNCSTYLESTWPSMGEDLGYWIFDTFFAQFHILVSLVKLLETPGEFLLDYLNGLNQPSMIHC